MMKRLFAAAFMSAAVLAFATPSSAALITTLHNTGVDSNGDLLAPGTEDTNYSVNGDETFAMLSTWPLGNPYLAVNPGDASTWISPIADGNTSADPNTTYTYTTTFDLTGLNPLTAVVAGRWSSDNDGYIVFNGTTIGFPVPYEGFGSWWNFALPTALFETGTNTLQFVVNNGPGDATGNPNALRVEFTTATADAQVPDGGTTLALLGGALLGLGAVRRRFNL